MTPEQPRSQQGNCHYKVVACLWKYKIVGWFFETEFFSNSICTPGWPWTHEDLCGARIKGMSHYCLGLVWFVFFFFWQLFATHDLMFNSHSTLEKPEASRVCLKSVVLICVVHQYFLFSSNPGNKLTEINADIETSFHLQNLDYSACSFSL